MLMKKNMLNKTFLITIFICLLITSCEDITGNFNIFSFLNPEKTVEEKLETAQYYMSKQTKTSYGEALAIYEKILAENPKQSDAIYGYATAFARKNEVENNVMGALTSLVALILDFNSGNTVTLLLRLYANKQELKEKQVVTYTIAKEVATVLDGLSKDIDNTGGYEGRVKSQDIWLDAVRANIQLCQSTLSTSNGQLEETTVLLLVWDPVTQKIKLDPDTIIQWVTKTAAEKTAVISASSDALQNAITIFSLHTGAEEFQGVNDSIDDITTKFNEFLLSLTP